MCMGTWSGTLLLVLAVPMRHATAEDPGVQTQSFVFSFFGACVKNGVSCDGRRTGTGDSTGVSTREDGRRLN